MIEYQDYIKLIQNIAYKYSSSEEVFEELKSECNLAFVECIPKYKEGKAKFSTFLYHSCKLKIMQYFSKLKKVKTIPLEETNLSYSMEKSIILIDLILNNKDEIIRSIAKIILFEEAPQKAPLEQWLRPRLKKFGYDQTSISDAFKFYKNLIEG
jgi:DNA-directed RNA polymerase specialized sigma subunit